MKQIVRYRFLTIPNKLNGEIRITVDDRAAEFTSAFEGGQSTSIALFPIVAISIARPSGMDDNGNRVKAPWNPNDSIGMTKFNLPIFLAEIKGIEKDMQTPDLYTYHGSRLELNDEAAAKIRRVFVIGNTTIELTSVVIEQLDETRVEGIKMKFNNEQSSVLLTLNELRALVYNLSMLNVDTLTFQLYQTYVTKKKPQNGNVVRNPNPTTLVDIAPLTTTTTNTTSSFNEFED